MTKFTLFIATLIFTSGFLFCVSGQSLLEENFSYPAGDTLTNYDWIQARNGNPVTVHNQGLVYPNYDLSGIGNAARIYAQGAQEIKKSFTEISNDSLYLSFLVNVMDASVNSSGGLFLYLTPPDGNIFSRRATIYVKKNESDNIAFGISRGSGIRYSGYDYSLNTTYLLVVKYSFDPDTTDVLSFWVDPDITQPESEPIRFFDTGKDLPSIAEIIISQLTASNEPPDAILDGIKITTSWPLAAVTGIEDAALAIEGFALSQNYPNPFNPKTTIEYSVRTRHAVSQHVNLSIYNLLGQKMATLVNKEQKAGTYNATWDAYNFPSGIYLYQLKAGDLTYTKRMMLIK